MNDGEVFPHSNDVALRLVVRDQMRRVVVTREALEAFLSLSPSEASALTLKQRKERVRRNVSSVVAAVNRKIDAGMAKGDVVVIFAGEM